MTGSKCSLYCFTVVVVFVVIVIIIRAQWRPQQGPLSDALGRPLSLQLGLEECFLPPHPHRGLEFSSPLLSVFSRYQRASRVPADTGCLTATCYSNSTKEKGQPRIEVWLSPESAGPSLWQGPICRGGGRGGGVEACRCPVSPGPAGPRPPGHTGAIEGWLCPDQKPPGKTLPAIRIPSPARCV